MMKKSLGKGFYFITDSTLSKQGNVHDVRAALEASVCVVQYREKCEPFPVMLEEARRLRVLCRTTLFIVNDALEVAIRVNADGLHIGQTDVAYHHARKTLGNEKIIGVSVRTLKEALQAQEMGADYIGVGPIFATSTKPDADKPCGTDLIYRIKKRCALPLVAIGGIHLENAKEVIAAGADCLCAISATVTKPDVKKEIDKYSKLFKMNNS